MLRTSIGAGVLCAGIVRTNSIGEPVFASPALANGRVYIRGERHLFAIK